MLSAKPRLCFNGNFPGGPGLAGTRMSAFGILLKLWIDGGDGDSWICKIRKALVRILPPANQDPYQRRLSTVNACCRQFTGKHNPAVQAVTVVVGF